MSRIAPASLNRSTAKAVAVARAPIGLESLSLLILAVVLVLLPGAAWMHAT